MTSRVWKFPLRNSIDPQEIRGPGLGHITLFGLQDQTFCVWGEVTMECDSVVRRVQIVPTGSEIPWDWEHVGSCQDGGYVWHLYREPV